MVKEIDPVMEKNVRKSDRKEKRERERMKLRERKRES